MKLSSVRGKIARLDPHDVPVGCIIDLSTGGRMAEVEKNDEQPDAPTNPNESGTMIVAALLILALAFAGYWITVAATSDRVDTSPLLLQFAIAAGAIVTVGICAYVLLSRKRGKAN
jgi:hypothetical protein